MTIKYICRHCGSKVGEINENSANEFQLGFHFLTPEERRDIISYNQDGQMTVHLICEYCTEAIETHPELSLQSSPLQ